MEVSMGAVKGAISVKDNMTAVLRSIKTEQSAFRKDVVSTRKELTKTWDKKYKARIESTSAAKAITSLNKKLAPIRKKIVTAVAIKDMVSSKIKVISNKVKAVGKIVATPVVKLKDGISSGVSKIKSKMKSIAKAVTIPVTIAAVGGAAALGGAVKGGMKLEQQQISIEHFVGATNKGADDATVKKISAEYINALRTNANSTPFETGDVIQAGSRAIAVSNGDTKEAMELVKLAEDMAAASGGTKTIGDAIEALADAKLGETERLKEFGFKVSAKEFESKGFKGVAKDLGDFYGGAAEKLSTSGTGLLSTIKGKLKSNFSDLGLQLVEKLKPAFDSIIGLIDKFAPVMAQFGGSIADSFGKGIEFISNVIPQVIAKLQTFKPLIDTIITAVQAVAPTLMSMGTTMMNVWSSVGQSMLPVITTIINTVSTVLPTILPIIQNIMTTIGTLISAAMPIISTMVESIGSVISTLAPIFNTIFGEIADKVGTVIGFISEQMGWIGEVFNTVAPLISDILSTAWKAISPIMDIMMNVFKVVFSVVKAVFPGIQKIIEVVWAIIKPIVDVIGMVLGAIGDAIGWIADAFTGGGGGDATEVGTNADGTNNWRGGVTWVGEKGPELIDVPRGARILPNKESIKYAEGATSQSYVSPSSPVTPTPAQQVQQSNHVTLSKLADQIIVREEADIERIGDTLTRKVLDAFNGLVPG